jgi:hypothetical protein
MEAAMAKTTPTKISRPSSTRSKMSQTFKVHPAADLLIENADLREAGKVIERMTDDKGQGQPIRNATTATLRANERALKEAREAAKVTADKYIAPLPRTKNQPEG